MNILYVTTSFAAKGPTRQLSYMSQNFRQKEEFQVKINALTKRRNAFIQLFEGCEIHFGLLMLYKSRKWADVAHTSGFLPDLMGFALFRKKKWIVTLRNNFEEDYQPKFGTFLGTVLGIIHRKVLAHCNNVVFCSPEIRQKQSSYFRRAILINNASIAFDSNQDTELEKTLVYCGALSKRKNIDKMLSIYMRTMLSELRFEIYGSGSAVDVSQLPLVEMKGFESDINSVYAKPKIFILLSLSEGLSNSVLEAIANKCILILSNIESHRYLKSIFPEVIVILNDNENLRVFESELKEVIINYPKINFTSVQKRYENAFGIERMVLDLARVYIE